MRPPTRRLHCFASPVIYSHISQIKTSSFVIENLMIKEILYWSREKEREMGYQNL
jgi:hypothetical protein